MFHMFLIILLNYLDEVYDLFSVIRAKIANKYLI